jgi:hypothetical protein
MMELAGGVQPASPIATPMRAISRNMKPVARPQSAVITDHTAMQSASRRTRFQRSAAIASGMPIKA